MPAAAHGSGFHPQCETPGQHVPSEGMYMRCTSAAHPAAELADRVRHGSMSSTPAGVVCPLSRLLPHTTTLLLHLCSSVCRRTGPGMCVVYYKPSPPFLVCCCSPGGQGADPASVCCAMRQTGHVCAHVELTLGRSSSGGEHSTAQHSDRDPAHLAGPGDWSIGPSHDRSYQRHSGAGLSPCLHAALQAVVLCGAAPSHRSLPTLIRRRLRCWRGRGAWCVV